MKRKNTNVCCSVTNCIYEKEGKCILSKIHINSNGRGDYCTDSSSTLCDSFCSRGNPLNYNYEYASEFLEEIPIENNKKEAMIMD